MKNLDLKISLSCFPRQEALNLVPRVLSLTPGSERKDAGNEVEKAL